jgi:putative Mg2+ transporter-C (MgtC) family protein
MAGSWPEAADIMPYALHYLEMAFRILLACLFGGIIGYEREQTNRPAGFRTHILVCVGSALVMMTGEYITAHFGSTADPARLGAQVVSGIGFLGAGTILRAGFNVRGLTTAASLWAVSCVGLACGIGFYSAATMSAVTICLILVVFKRFEHRIWMKNTHRTVTVRTKRPQRALTDINALFSRIGAEIKNTEFLTGNGPRDALDLSIRFTIKMPNCSIPDLYDEVNELEDIDGVTIE